MPADGKRLVRTSGGGVAVVDAGAPEAPAVVFVHGYPTSSFLWRSFVPSVVTDMRVIAVDLLGAGDSDKPVDAALDLRAQAAYVRELLASLGVTSFAVVAHGDGGAVAQRLAVDPGVEALVLIDSAAFDVSPSAAIRRAVNAPSGGPADMLEEILRAGSVRGEAIAPHAVTEYARPFLGEGHEAALDRWASARADDLSGLTEDLRRIEAPTFLLWGEEDPFVGADVAERLGDVIETSALALLPGCGHFLPEEAPQTIVPLVVQWLAGRYLGRAHGHAQGPVLYQVERMRSEADG